MTPWVSLWPAVAGSNGITVARTVPQAVGPPRAIHLPAGSAARWTGLERPAPAAPRTVDPSLAAPRASRLAPKVSHATPAWAPKETVAARLAAGVEKPERCDFIALIPEGDQVPVARLRAPGIIQAPPTAVAMAPPVSPVSARTRPAQAAGLALLEAAGSGLRLAPSRAMTPGRRTARGVIQARLSPPLAAAIDLVTPGTLRAMEVSTRRPEPPASLSEVDHGPAAPPVAVPIERIDARIEPPAPPVDRKPEALDQATEVAQAALRETLARPKRLTAARVLRLIRLAGLAWTELLRPGLGTWRGRGLLAAMALLVLAVAASRGSKAPLRGSLAWVTDPLRHRAYYQYEDGFRQAASDWNGAGLERQDDGLMKVRQGLTLFTPSLNRSEYEWSFNAAVRRGALGWVVRGADAENYYAFKLTWRGKGRERKGVLVRYAVVKGVEPAPEKYQVAALAFKLEENQSYDITVGVSGERITTVVGGRGVDSFSDSRLRTGGVGFLAGPGEMALIHSMTLAGNDDPNGRTLAWIIGFAQFLARKVSGS